ncbi:MAG: ATP/GTP-binding protein [Coleofasciculaceae cyanobacterium]
MKTMRSVVAGTVGAGKTTFVHTLSDIEVVSTDRPATDETLFLKSETTVALDFGRLILSPNMDLHIYGTPGQSRFDFMWDLLIQNAHNYILLVAAHRPDNFQYSREILTFINQRVQIPMLIGLTHTDCPGAVDSAEIMKMLGYDSKSQDCPPIIKVNPTEKASVTEALVMLMALVIERSNVKLSETPYNKNKASS